ncbi:MAG: HlyD family efflux transporter periplasmic adaptor subunit [Planctomycetota bacterium]|nr:MAG: HlyD family efflux transporter periplasmic adaptor subunit [Planctomycetota bacterium]
MRIVEHCTLLKIVRPAAAAFLAAACCTAAGCNGPASEASGAPGGGRPPAQVRVAPVVQQDVQPEVIVVGTVVARRTSVVASGADGQVDQFLVREGDVVEEGQELSILRMVTTNLGIAEAEQVLAERQHELEELEAGSRVEERAEAIARMEAAKVARDVAARKLERMENLAEKGAANQDDLDDARERAEAAVKLFEAAEAQWEMVEAGPREEVIAVARARRDGQREHVEFLKAEKNKRTTVAPFAGVVVDEGTERGQWLSKGDPVATISDLLEEVHVIANVDQRELGNVQIGRKVQVVIEGAPQQEWEGTVLSIVPRSEWQSGSRAFPVKVAVPNRMVEGSGDRSIPMLTEGMLARVTFTGPKRNAVLVPKDAVIRSESGSLVYAVVPGDSSALPKARPVPIVDGPGYGPFVELLEGELQPGTQVVVEGGERLQPFAEIVIQDDPEQAESPSETSDASGEPLAPDE